MDGAETNSATQEPGCLSAVLVGRACEAAIEHRWTGLKRTRRRRSRVRHSAVLAHALTGDLRIGLYGSERCVIDAFRLRHQEGPDVAAEALRRWLRRPGSHPSALLAMARHFPKALPALRTALQVLL